MSGDGVAREVIGRLRVGELDYLLVSQAKESGGQACDCDLIEIEHPDDLIADISQAFA
jgi:hypothetical protein